MNKFYNQRQALEILAHNWQIVTLITFETISYVENSWKRKENCFILLSIYLHLKP